MEEDGEMGGCSVAAVKLILWLIANDKCCCSSSASLCCCLVHAGCPVHSDTPLLLCLAVSWFRQQKRKLSFVAQFLGLFFFLVILPTERAHFWGRWAKQKQWAWSNVKKDKFLCGDNEASAQLTARTECLALGALPHQWAAWTCSPFCCHWCNWG